MKAGLASSSKVHPIIALHLEQNSTGTRAREDLRYGFCRLLSSSSLRCALSSTQCASDNSFGSLPLADSDCLVRVELDNSRISSRISATRSGGLGGRLIYVTDAADLELCLLLRSFFIIPGTREGHERKRIALLRFWIRVLWLLAARVSKRKAGRRFPDS
jgi:hypothetical protein